MDILFQLLDWVSLIILGVLVLFRRKRMLEAPFKYLTWWIGVRFFEILYIYGVSVTNPAAEWGNYGSQVFALAELLTLVFFLRQLSETWLTHHFYLVTGIMLAAGAALLVYMPGIYSTEACLLILSVIGLVYCIDFLIQQVRLPIPQSVPNVPLFWMVCGLLVFHLGATLVYGAEVVFSREQRELIMPGMQYASSLIHLCGTGMQVLIMIGLLQLRRSWQIGDAFSFNM